MWSEIEYTLKTKIENSDKSRKFCSYCGLRDPELLGRCYGCQMIYYCSQEHQQLDWLENHMPICSELEWANLCEIIDTVPIDLNPVYALLPWNSNCIKTWTDWFELRSNLVESIRLLSKTIYQEIFSNKSLLVNRRVPQVTDILDGVLAKVTQIMSFPITIGTCIKNLNCTLDTKPLCIHILYPPNDIFEDLVSNYINGETEGLDFCIKKKFLEILNMFPNSENSIEIVLISTNPYLNTANFDEFSKTELIDWSKLMQNPVLKKDLDLLMSKRGVYLSAWQGSYSNYIKYACNNSDGYLEPDLVVAFDPNFTKSPHKLITDWTDDLKVILTNSYPCLFTFSDKLELDKASNILNAFQTNIISCQSNQFSSLLLRQYDVLNKPQRVYASNGFFILFKGFANKIDTQSINHKLSGAESLKRSKSIHDLLKYHIQTDACVQTMGLNQPDNPSLRHINGKIQISKTQIIQQKTCFQSSENLNPTLNMIDIFIENKEFENSKQIPSLEFSGQIDYDAKIDYSTRLKISPRKPIENRYYQPRPLIRPDLLMIKPEEPKISPRNKPCTKPRQIVVPEEPTPQVKPRYTVQKEENSITSTESNIKNEIEFFSTSSSSNLSTSSSNRSSSSSSFCAPTQGFVSQMRNIFESPEKQKNLDNKFCKKKIFNNYETALISMKKGPIYENLNFSKSDPIVDLGPPSTEPPPPPLPLSPPPVEIENESVVEFEREPKQRLSSATSSSTNYTIKSDFRILNAERNSSCSKSLSMSQNVLIKDIPDSVDEVKFQYEGQRHVIVPGYMTSADILRNVLLNNTNTNSLPCNLKKSEPFSLKEKLIKLNEKDDEFLSKKFSQKSRTRTLSGVINLEQNDIVDIDLDYESKPPVKPPRTFDSEVIEDKMYSIRTVSSRGSTRKAPNSKCITGSFDPNDFDSFDEGDFEPNFDDEEEKRLIPIESLDKIIDDGLTQQKIEYDLKKQEDNLVQFDPNDFDSFDEEDVPEVKVEQNYQIKPEIKRPMERNSSINNQNQSFLRSAFDRLSVKNRSSSVPMRTLIEKQNDKPTNQKTLNLMSKIQNDLDEKQKVKHEKRQKKLEEEKKKLNNDQTHRKSLSSILNFFTSSNSAPSSNSSNTEMIKNESKRLSLRRLKAKKKTKNSDNFECQSDFDSVSTRSLNLDSESENIEVKQSLYSVARSNSRIKNELDDKKQNLKPNIMEQLKAELDEEIKERQLIERKNEIIQSSTFNRRSSTRESVTSKKIRSKSVTFLDELSSEEENNFQSSNYLQEMTETKSSLRAGDARLFAGALTGAGPVRSIIKKSMNDLGVIENCTDQLPKVKLDCLEDDLTKMVKSQTTPNFRRKEQILQSDL
ncbi:unnamed protein product [Brachionus calyciflorus]|uniref:MYND-type domain-containing protein n=1 Tax=Brachionus calyciflorus TaxID=104777 RepID=A0A813M8F8_9BILA|nr:unnamed protein product [Brachionus calyciflorus]